ncbi:MAG: efflux RND transporter periplasmic adaptor subunit [Gammaproteobacteria bacterium]
MIFFNLKSDSSEGLSLLSSTVIKALFISFVILLGSCSKEPEKVKEIIRPAKIVTVTAGGEAAKRSFPGEIEASDRSELAFRLSGELITLPVRAGNKIKKGQLLAQLDPRDFKLALRDKQAKFDLAKVQYKRMEELVAKGLVPRAEFDKAKSQLQVATADLELAKANLDDTNLRAPYSGVISSIPVQNHESVQLKQTIMTILSEGTVDVVFQLPESIMAHVRKDQSGKTPPTVIFDAHPDKKYRATLKEYDTEADPQTQTYRVVLTMDTPGDFPVLPGMTVSVRVNLKKILDISSALVVPVESVFAAKDAPVDSKERYVWRVAPDTMTVTRSAVTVGRLSSFGIEVKSGLKEGDKIVTAGVHFLVEGQKIREWTRERGL